MLSIKKIVLGTVGYLLITFPLALAWHLMVFKETYDQLGYITRKEPIMAFGFGAILLQGVLLSVLYPLVCRGTTLVGGALRFMVLLGGYHWTMHVLAAAAKQTIEPLTTWFPLESVYLCIQFLLGSFLLAVVYRGETKLSPAHSPLNPGT